MLNLRLVVGAFLHTLLSNRRIGRQIKIGGLVAGIISRQLMHHGMFRSTIQT
jgi:hypothetical protein